MNFKKTLLASLLMISASGAFAADTATLLVKGTIAPTACDVTIGSAGQSTLTFDVTDYDGTAKQLEPQSIPFNIACNPSATAVTYAVSDNTSAPSMGNEFFGLGTHNEAQIGYFRMKQTDAMVDGAAASPIFYENLAGRWVVNSAINKFHVGYSSFSSAGTLVPVEAKDFSSTLTVSPTINAGLPINGGVRLDGSATFTITMI